MFSELLKLLYMSP